MLFSLAGRLVISVLVCPQPAPVADVYVDLNVANCAAGTGTIADPVCSINVAIALASPGDTIRIAPGTYVENVAIGFDLDLIGTGGALVTMVDGGLAGTVITIPSAVTVAIDGLTVVGGLSSGAGGIQVDGSLVLTNSTVRDNHSTFFGGGGIGSFMPGADVTIEACVIADNFASRESLYIDSVGGGVFVKAGALTIRDTTISGNRAERLIHEHYNPYCWDYGGGGVSSDGTSVRITGSTINDNRATCAGGGVRLSGDYAFIANTTISGNRGASGGGAFVSAGDVVFENVTIFQNDSKGYHVYTAGLEIGFSGDATLRNCVVAGNLRLDGIVPRPSDLGGSSLASNGHNLVGSPNGASLFGQFVDGDQIGVSGFDPLDALLGLLQDNGGPTFTHAPLPGSPVSDMGDALVFESLDQRGVARPVGAASDIGAFEGGQSYLNFCNGDGGNQQGCTNCPCTNNAPAGSIGGCLNSSGLGTRLEARGNASVALLRMSLTDLRFGLSQAPANVLCLLVSGSALAPENQQSPCFALRSGVQAMPYDGLRCAIMNIKRHGTRSADANGVVGSTGNSWGGEGGPPAGLANAGVGFATGQTRYFQAVHRENAVAGCMRGLNTSQAIEVVFTP